MKAKGIVTREELKKEFLKKGGVLGGEDAKQTGIFMALISNQLGQIRKDYLRQVILYNYPNNTWEKDNFQIDERHIHMVKQVLEKLEQ